MIKVKINKPKGVTVKLTGKYISGMGNIYDGGGADISNIIDLGNASVGDNAKVIDFGKAQ